MIEQLNNIVYDTSYTNVIPQGGFVVVPTLTVAGSDTSLIITPSSSTSVPSQKKL